MNLDIIVIGNGHSGTLYMSKVLTACGYKCSHQVIFTAKGIKEDTGFNAESSFAAVAYLDQVDYKELIHVIRHPVEVVRSYVMGGFTLENVYWVCDILGWKHPKIVDAEFFLKRWVAWTNLCLDTGAEVWRLGKDTAEDWGFKQEYEVAPCHSHVPEGTREWTWDDIPDCKEKFEARELTEIFEL